MELAAFASGTTDLADQFTSWFGSLFGEHAKTAIAVLKIIGINIVLSGDNAVVIALACRGLPASQRRLGILLGAGAAVVLRIIFTVIVQKLLNVPYLQIAGGLLLFWIAIKLLGGEEADEDAVASGSTLYEAVKIVAIADIVMSLDNVLAIAAAAKSAPAAQQIFLIILGLAISIPLVVAGSTLIMALLSRYPIFVWVGAALLGWVAGELLVSDRTLVERIAAWDKSLVVAVSDPDAPYPFKAGPIVHYSAAALGALLVVLVGWVRTRGRREGHAHGSGDSPA